MTIMIDEPSLTIGAMNEKSMLHYHPFSADDRLPVPLGDRHGGPSRTEFGSFDRGKIASAILPTSEESTGLLARFTPLMSLTPLST